MGCPAEAVETILVRISVEPHHLDGPDASSGKAMRDIGFEVELGMPLPLGGEEAFVIRIVMFEAALEVAIDLVACARDARGSAHARASASARPRPVFR